MSAFIFSSSLVPIPITSSSSQSSSSSFSSSSSSSWIHTFPVSYPKNHSRKKIQSHRSPLFHMSSSSHRHRHHHHDHHDHHHHPQQNLTDSTASLDNQTSIASHNQMKITSATPVSFVITRGPPGAHSAASPALQDQVNALPDLLILGRHNKLTAITTELLIVQDESTSSAKNRATRTDNTNINTRTDTSLNSSTSTSTSNTIDPSTTLSSHASFLIHRPSPQTLAMASPSTSTPSSSSSSSSSLMDRATQVWVSMGAYPYITVVIALGYVLKKFRQIRGQQNLHKAVIQFHEQEKELHIYKCGGCGYEIWPARGREFKFFPDNFKCPLCGAAKSEFWDLNDENDPRNQVSEEEDDDNDDDNDNQEQHEDDDQQNKQQLPSKIDEDNDDIKKK